MDALWILIRWMAEVVANGKIQSEYFYEMPGPARDFMYEVGEALLELF